MTRMLDLKGMPKHYFKSLLGTCPYELVRLPHSQLVSQVLPVFPHMTHQFLIYSDNQIVAIRWVFYYLISISFSSSQYQLILQKPIKSGTVVMLIIFLQ